MPHLPHSLVYVLFVADFFSLLCYGLFLLFVQLNVESPFLVKIQTEIEDETIQTEMMMMAMVVVVMDQPEGRRNENNVHGREEDVFSIRMLPHFVVDY